MRVRLLDTVTGETRQHEGATPFWWMEGNGSCDCNREIAFGRDTAQNFCLGAHRYLVIAAEFEPERDDDVQPPALFELNQDYPKELLQKHLPMTTEPLHCESHNRDATSTDKNGHPCCDPALPGSTLPCKVANPAYADAQEETLLMHPDIMGSTTPEQPEAIRLPHEYDTCLAGVTVSTIGDDQFVYSLRKLILLVMHGRKCQPPEARQIIYVELIRPFSNVVVFLNDELLDGEVEPEKSKIVIPKNLGGRRWSK